MAENYDDFGEMAHDVRRAIDRKREEIRERLELLHWWLPACSEMAERP